MVPSLSVIAEAAVRDGHSDHLVTAKVCTTSLPQLLNSHDPVDLESE